MSALSMDIRTPHYKKVIGKLQQFLGFLNYRIKQTSHARRLPNCLNHLQSTIEEVKRTGVHVGNLDNFDLGDVSQFKSELGKARDYLNRFEDHKPDDFGYETGFDHCIPIPPAEIAQKFPYLFYWGLNEDLLNFMENLIGLPVAYHGVVVRKEIVNEDIVGSRVWHMDSEDRNIIRILIYMTDVLDESGGPFEYIPIDKSPTYRDFKNEDASNISDQRMAEFVDATHWKQALGPSGTIIIGRVAKMFHRGHLPMKPRQVASYYYTTRNPTNEDLTMEFSFRDGIPYIDPEPLNKRQLDCLWKYTPELGKNIRSVSEPTQL